MSNKHGRSTSTGDKGLSTVVLCHVVPHTQQYPHTLKRIQTHTHGRIPWKRPVYDKRRKAKHETKACLETYVVIFMVVRKDRKSPSAPEFGTPHYDVCRGRSGNVQLSRVRVTNLLWKAQGHVLGNLVMLYKLPPETPFHWAYRLHI